MFALLLESALRATLIALAIGLVLRLLKIHAAPVRHAVWTAVATGMLLMPALLTWGPETPIPALAAKPAPDPIVILDAPASVATVHTPLYSGPIPQSPAAIARQWNVQAWLLAIYGAGLIVLLTRLAIGAWRVRRLLDESRLRNGMLTHTACSTPITVGWFRPTIILPEHWTSWPPEQRDIVLAHEREHVRRRDPLFQSLALLNRAVFWFHPLAWWLERRISELAEQSCDQAVLQQGHNPHTYSAYLLNLARAIQHNGARVQVAGMAMPGFGLPQRIRQILAGVPVQRITRPRLIATTFGCAAIAAVLASGQLAEAQSNLTFEVASIKPADPNAVGSRAQLLGGNRMVVTNLTLLDMIRGAYSDFGQFLEVTGGPDWLGTKRFNVEAKAGKERPTSEELEEMQRTLLADRFGVRVHWESKEAPVFALVLSRKDGKLGPGATPFAEAVCPKDDPEDPDATGLCGISFGPAGMTVEGGTMEDLANVLAMPPTGLDRKVVDRTGLTGRFNVKFDYPFTVRPGGMAPGNPTPETGPSLFTALEEQLGVKLESARGQVEYLVVDQAELPGEN